MKASIFIFALAVSAAASGCKEESRATQVAARPALPVWEPIDGTFTGCEGG